MPRHFYPSFKSSAQTDRQTLRYITGSSRYTPPCYQISILYFLLIQSYFHSCEFHQLSPSWSKMHSKILSLWLLQAHLLTYISIKHCLKIFNIYVNIGFLNIYLHKHSWHWPSHCPLSTYRQCLHCVNDHSLDKYLNTLR